MPIWNPEFETMARADLEQLQARRLRDVVARVAATVPFYQEKFAAANLSADDIHSLDDLNRLPFTQKDDLRQNYPFGMFTVPIEDVARIHASSGTTGKPTTGGYTAADLEIWAEVMARTVAATGVTDKDVAHNAYGYGLFTGGLGFHLGFETVGAAVVPVSGGFTQRQIMLMEDFGATVMTATPSYALVLAEEAEEMGVNFKERMKVRIGIFGAEPWSEKMRHDIEERLGLDAFDIYGLTEIIGPGVSVECEHHAGMHIFEDHFLAEIIDPETGDQLPFGEAGELVFTTLTKEAMPVIRYRTRDRTVLHAEKCACGRTMVRMEKVFGRTDDMLIVRGVNVFPQLIERSLLEVDGLVPQYQIVIDRQQDSMDTLDIMVETAPDYNWSDNEHLENLRRHTAREIHQALGITAEIKLMELKTIERSIGKARRVIDKRELSGE